MGPIDNLKDVNLHKVLITVGTTPFDKLIEYFDCSIKDFAFTFQISSGTYIPKNGNWSRSINNFESLVDEFDLIVTHAGAGSVYSFLERGKRMIIVPNTQRNDKHQLELANYIRSNRFACVLTIDELYSLTIEAVIEDALEFKGADYLKDDFFYSERIVKFFNGENCSL